MNGIKTIKSKNKLPSNGSGYIVIPGDVSNKDIYIAQVYSQERVAIFIEKIGYLPSVRITRSAIREITFPEIGKLGMGIIWLSTDGGEVFVIDTMSRGSESLLLNDKEYKFEKHNNIDSASIAINGGGFTLEIASNYIKKFSKKFIYRAKELFDIRSDKKIIIDSEEEIQIGLEELEPALKGDKTLEKLNNIIDVEESLNSTLEDITKELQKFGATGAGAATGVLAPLQPAFQALNLAMPGILVSINSIKNNIAEVRNNIDLIKSELLKIE